MGQLADGEHEKMYIKPQQHSPTMGMTRDHLVFKKSIAGPHSL